jgi:hypothetical protein
MEFKHVHYYDMDLLGQPTYIYNAKPLLRMKKRHEATTGVSYGHVGTV